ncbi:MAG: hypothetical protein QOI80_1167 [Solirubrobacteraceae bacterium]|nr:hypothetical protein [Solirubrobacteraceae bacterium]
MTAAIEWDLLGDVIWQSLVAGIGVTALFSLVVFGSSRAAEARREGANPTIYGALALISLLAVTGVVVLAITVILNKS